MSDLQLSLLALGAAIIATVALFNWWQERQINKSAANLDMAGQDALMSNDSMLDSLNEDAIIVTRKTIEPTDTPANSANTDDLQEEPSFAVSHESDQFDNEHTLDQSSSTWEKLSGQASNGLEDSAEPTQQVNAESIETKLSEDEESQAELNDVRVSEQSIAPAKSPIAVELTEEELDILNAIPAPPASLAAKLGIQHDHIDLAEQTEMIADAPAAHQENGITLRHDGLPAQIIDEIDHAGLVVFNQATSIDVLDTLHAELSALGKPIQAFGLGADNTWVSLAQAYSNSDFVKVAYALQLADRSGPTPKITLHKFQSAIEAHAKKIGAKVEWHGQADPYVYAADLDGFCVQVDQLIRFHLIQGASGPFTGTKFRGLAESSGLTLGENGAFHYKNDHGQILFSIINADNNPFNAEMLRNIGLRGVNFELDIPRVENSTEAFNLMMMAAKKMEASLFAQLVDDNHRALTDVHLEKIRQQLRVINSQMVSRGIIPGSACALRLFS